MAVSGEKTSVIQMTAAADAIDKHLIVKSFAWTGMTNSTHTLIIKDTAGNELWHRHATTALETEEQSFDSPLFADGVKVDTIGSGDFYIYLE